MSAEAPAPQAAPLARLDALDLLRGLIMVAMALDHANYFVARSHVGNEFWFVSEFGESSQYVKNIQADPAVRVRLNGKWHKGTAHIVADDDARERLRSLPQFNSFGVRTFEVVTGAFPDVRGRMGCRTLLFPIG